MSRGLARGARSPLAAAVAVALALVGVGVGSAPAGAAPAPLCTSVRNPAFAARLSADIRVAVARRGSTTAVAVLDRSSSTSCQLRGAQQFDSASVVKVAILGTVLRQALDQHRFLTAREVQLTTAMITSSDNAAASALWRQIGRPGFLRFLRLVGMNHTIPGPGGFWGLTQITAYDELVLLHMLTYPTNTVLSANSRAYALRLLGRVIPSQRWGVPAGAPVNVSVHVKNGWVPRPTHGWRVHSIGAFYGSGGNYLIVVLTQDDPTMGYGIATIESIARVIHRDIAGGRGAALPDTAPAPSWGVPDESLPAFPNGG